MKIKFFKWNLFFSPTFPYKIQKKFLDARNWVKKRYVNRKVFFTHFNVIIWNIFGIFGNMMLDEKKNFYVYKFFSTQINVFRWKKDFCMQIFFHPKTWIWVKKSFLYSNLFFHPHFWFGWHKKGWKKADNLKVLKIPIVLNTHTLAVGYFSSRRLVKHHISLFFQNNVQPF